MILFDSNILVYSASNEYKYLRDLIKNNQGGYSIISKLEVLGYHKITTEQTKYFDAIFNIIDCFPITEEVISQAIKYRKKFNMSVGDAIIGATAKIYNCTLYTNNVKDFKNINDIKIVNPIL